MNGVVTLDENKTDEPRAWALSAGVVAALRALRPKEHDPRALAFWQPPDPGASLGAYATISSSPG